MAINMRRTRATSAVESSVSTLSENLIQIRIKNITEVGNMERIISVAWKFAWNSTYAQWQLPAKVHSDDRCMWWRLSILLDVNAFYNFIA
ncbi:hypothetical protein Y032_0218g2430 [Ancylostoma ceylanicum]|uniref:Uncharacterized protein n=1 Tax=Ancylostoma ceylanicum TaxID=53326 RepID=A0A016SJ07_9BILA|nr:hypothetical protein Y032_0218g2430 [Ancylostoma ceylanicum]